MDPDRFDPTRAAPPEEGGPARLEWLFGLLAVVGFLALVTAALYLL